MHSDHLGPMRSDLISLAGILHGVSSLVRHRRPTLANIMAAAGGAAAILFLILYFSQAR